MRYYLLIAGILVMMLLAAGCSDDGGGTGTPAPTPVVQEANYTAGDIVAKTATSAEPLWLVIRYDKSADHYERAFIYKKLDGSWGYRKDNRTELAERGLMEKVYPVKVAHVAVSSVAIEIQTPPVPATTVPSGLAPDVTGITPNTGASGSSITITSLAGRNFQQGATVKLIGAGAAPVVATDVQVIDTKITCVFNLNGAIEGKRDVVVTNPDGQSGTLNTGFTVNPVAPVISGIDPLEGRAGETLTLTITGSNFKNPAKVIFTRGITEIEGANVRVHSATQISTVLAIPAGTQPGLWNVVVRNVVDKQNGTALNRFTINNAT